MRGPLTTRRIRQVLYGRPTIPWPFERPRLHWEDNVSMDAPERGTLNGFFTCWIEPLALHFELYSCGKIFGPKMPQIPHQAGRRLHFGH